MLKKALKSFFKNKYLVILLLLGIFTWSLTMVKSGLVYEYGMGFWGPNGHDGVWHIALANSLSKGSLTMPIFSNETLSNYHIGFDLLLAFLHRITFIPIVNLYFQILPPVMAFLIGILSYKFVYIWTKSKIKSLWSLFFVYFGGSFGWLVSFFRGEGIGGESMFWSQQAISTLINPPFALSIIFLLIGLLFLQKKKLLLSIVFFGLLIEIKAYAGILALGALLMISIIEIFKNRDNFYLKVFGGSLVLSAVVFLPLNNGASSVLIWQPFWFLETMLGLSDRLNWPKLYSAIMNYKLENSPKLIPAYILAAIIFWFGNLGTRLIKELILIKWIINYKKTGFLEIFFSCVITAGVAIPLLFVQKGTPWNTIQFIYYSLFFSSILAGIVVGEIQEKLKDKIKPLFAAVIIVFTVPTTIDTLRHYTPSRPPAKISHEELEALTFLSKKDDGIVLTYLFDKYKAEEQIQNPPRPLYLYESTSYVSAFSKKNVFLEDQVNLDITGYDWKLRRSQIEEFYKSNDQSFVREFLLKNKIRYIYWIKGQRATLGETQLGIERIFENSLVDIYEVNLEAKLE